MKVYVYRDVNGEIKMSTDPKRAPSYWLFLGTTTITLFNPDGSEMRQEGE